MKKLKVWIRVLFIRLPKEIKRYLTDLYNVEQLKYSIKQQSKIRNYE